MDPSFTLQLSLELDRALPLETLRDAVEALAGHNPLTTCRLRGVLGWSRWQPGSGRPRVGCVDGVAWDGRSLAGAAFLEAPLEAPVEVLVVEGQVPRLLVRCDHALVDGVGILGLVRDLFDVLNGRRPSALPLGPADHGLVGDHRAEPAAPVDVGSPLGPARSDAVQRVWAAARTAPHDRLMARLVRATFRGSRRYTDRPIRVDVPVDLRRHGVAGSGNLTGLVQLTLDQEPTLDQVHERLGRALEARRELDAVVRMRGARWLPVSWLAGLGRAGARRSLASDAWQSSVTLSHLGRHDLADFGGPELALRRVVPVAPASRGLPLNLTFLADRDGVELSASSPAAVGGGGRLEELLGAVVCSLR